MDVARPYRSVVPTLDGDVLVVLAGTTRPLTGRQIAALVKRASYEGVRQALDRLVEQGIVRREGAGRAWLYTLNRDHLAAVAVEELAGLRTQLIDRLRRTLSGWAVAPVHASLFGSAARADGDTHSDIDLFLVRPAAVDEDEPAWREQVSELIARVQAWTGNHASVIEQDERELIDLRASAPPVLAELRADAIELAGTPLRRLTRDAV